MTHPYVCRRAGELMVREIRWEVAITRRFGRAVARTLALYDFELWRHRLIRLMLVPAALLVAYWTAWFGDRTLVASDHTAVYVAFEQSFPLGRRMAAWRDDRVCSAVVAPPSKRSAVAHRDRRRWRLSLCTGCSVRPGAWHLR
jgi:hypothetical protein